MTIRIGDYLVSVPGLVGAAALLAFLVVALWGLLARVWVRYFSRIFPSDGLRQDLEDAANRYAKAAESFWGDRPNLVGVMRPIMIGSILGVVGVALVFFNLQLLARIMDYLYPGGGETVVMVLPLLGDVGEYSTLALVLAIIVAFAEMGLGVTLFYAWPAPVEWVRASRRSKHEGTAPALEQMTPARIALAIAVGVVAIGAVVFEMRMNSWVTAVLEEGGTRAIVAAATVGAIIPTGEIIFSGLALHTAVLNIGEWLFHAIVVAVYRVLAFLLRYMAYPPGYLVPVVMAHGQLCRIIEGLQRIEKELESVQGAKAAAVPKPNK